VVNNIFDRLKHVGFILIMNNLSSGPFGMFSKLIIQWRDILNPLQVLVDKGDGTL
jgi:hypothetical protein